MDVHFNVQKIQRKNVEKKTNNQMELMNAVFETWKRDLKCKTCD